MEFIAGIIFTLVVGFIGNKAYQSYKRKQQRKAYIPPSGPRPDLPRDYPDPDQDRHHKHIP